MSHSLALLLLLLFCVAYTSWSLECIQCGRNQGWYDDNNHDEHMKRCQKGEFKPTECGSKETHCIVSFFKDGISKVPVVTERKCGTLADDTGCTLFGSNGFGRNSRHLIEPETNSKSETPYVEVCSMRCDVGTCVSGSRNTFTFLVLLIIPVIVLRN